MNGWKALKTELQRQVMADSHSFGEIVELVPDAGSDFQLILKCGTREMQLRYLPETNVVRWETAKQYGFERIPEPAGPLAAQLMQWLHQR